MTNIDLRHILRATRPKFHHWGGRDEEGGLSNDMLDYIVKLGYDNSGVNERPQIKVLETGAGLSTLAFLAEGWQTTSVSLDDVIARIKRWLDNSDYVEFAKLWTPLGGRSDSVLPVLLESSVESYDVSFIDGSHSVNAVFVDYTYCSRMLKRGGLLIIDDTQLPGPRLLTQMLDQSADWRIVGTFAKMSAYLKNGSWLMDNNMDKFEFRYPPVS
jgi:hypothetical protein